MPYGTIKVDNIIFTNSGSDQTVTVSGLYASTSGNLTVTGTVSGTTANFVSGTFSTQLSGATITGNVGRFTTVTGVNATLTTATITSGIFAAGTATSPSVAIGVGTTYTPGIYAPGTDQVAISTSGTGRLFVNSSGNVGIGTINPSQLLQVNGNVLIGATPAAQYSNFTVVGDSAIQAASPLFNFVNAAGSTRFGYINHTGTAGDIYILNQEAGAIRLGSNNQERLRITSAGDVGIGTSGPAPGSKLEVVGTIRAQSGGNIIDLTSDGGIELTKSTGPYIDFKTSNVDFDCRIEQANNGFVFQTGGGGVTGEKLRILANGNVGIGTSNPGTKLSIGNGSITIQNSSAAAVTDLGIRFDIDANSQGRIYSPSGKSIAIQAGTGGSLTDAVTVDQSGRVGIGISSPNTKLDVAGQIRALDTVDLRLNPIPGGNAGIVGTYSNHDLVFYRNGIENARIDSSGRLLVGTSSATSNSRLNQTFAIAFAGAASFGGAAITNYCGTDQAAGPILDLNRSRGTTDGSFTKVEANDRLGSLIFRGSDGAKFLDGAIISAWADGATGTDDLPTRLVFSTTADGASSPTERMRISNNGTVAINTISSPRQLSVAHSGRDGLEISDTNASTVQANLLFTNTRAGGTSNYYILGYSNSVQTLIIFSNGNIQNTNNSYGAISDIKLKENIVDASSQWDDLKALQVRKYNFKEGQTHTQIGLIAQEVELVSPGLVTESPDRDEEGNDLGTVTKSVNYSVLYMKAVKALQEAMERIETLEAKVAASY